MNAPRFEVVRGNMERVVEPVSSPRLEQLLVRAESLGLSAGIVNSHGPVLVVSIFDGVRLLGNINIWPATDESEERWHLDASCNVMTGLPMQADWLLEGAKRVKAAFDAMAGAS